jgi:hypothetical protein
LHLPSSSTGFDRGEEPVAPRSGKRKGKGKRANGSAKPAKTTDAPLPSPPTPAPSSSPPEPGPVLLDEATASELTTLNELEKEFDDLGDDPNARVRLFTLLLVRLRPHAAHRVDIGSQMIIATPSALAVDRSVISPRTAPTWSALTAASSTTTSSVSASSRRSAIGAQRPLCPCPVAEQRPFRCGLRGHLDRVSLQCLRCVALLMPRTGVLLQQ